MTTVVVTGSSGKAGQAIVSDLATDYELITVDMLAAPSGQAGSHYKADLTDLGQCYDVLHGADMLVHMANIPAPGLVGRERTFNNNINMNYNLFQATCDLGLQRVVWASSETTLGLPFDTPPKYAPVDEAHFPLPESSYALSKVLTEQMAEQFHRWSGIPFIGLRFSNILNEEVYKTFPTSCWPDAHARKWNLWGYIDERDVAQACRKGLTADVQGAENVIIAANDTVMNRPSRDLMAEVFPTVLVADDLPEYGTLLSNQKAKTLLGFDPQVSWRD
ncbi:MAG: NAD(P)-dependent oxidoreductase, partial [Deinococcota bacterium]